jgi:hypothetical protein
MRAGRKPKRQDDDEPLVPHGLISQALDSPPSPPENSVPIQANPQQASDILPKRPPARALQWPRAARQVKEGIKDAHILPKTSAELRKHVQVSTHQFSEQLKQIRSDASTRGNRIRESAQQFSAHLMQIRSAASAHADRIRGNLARLIPPASANIHRSVQVSVNAARKFIVHCANWTVGLFRSASTRSATAFRRISDTSSSRLTHMRTKTELPANTTRAGIHLRVKLSGIPLKARIALARARSELDLRRESLSGNSRLRTSVALGALSALMVMGIFSTARHYANGSLPSKRAASASSTKAADIVSPVAPIPTKAVARVSAVPRSQLPSAPKPKPAQRKIERKTVAARPKMHRNEDEDYVAKDTYVYYGRRPSGQTKTAKD